MPDSNDYAAEKVRQGEIILPTRTRRLVFAIGLIALIILAVALRTAIQM